ncbi:hypothetical protein LSH36_683g02048 [Paralvinella palmiformis]|uniref:thioredoxin-disulfide reductase (NADPH) n=1 Tax=Paralvinella palmiformis TaxID=53620 RepID=A0AAD9MWA2_9ANNE|nr:hypothetical protein LSH36_683g02048 [Paralvinella palmiformis]
MPPIDGSDGLKAMIEDLVNKNRVMIFSKSACPYCLKAKDLFKSINVEYHAVELDKLDNGPAIQDTLQAMTGQRTVPNTFINGKHLGGYDSTLKAKENKTLEVMLDGESYDYDLVVIGGGSGGLACAKEAVKHGVKVACLDFVKPSPQGTTWGLGGTCVNVGCIPKKLMHQASILGHSIEDAKSYGWELKDEKVKHNWETMKNAIQDHIGSLNWNYRVELRSKEVTYQNSYGEFIDKHKIKCTNKRGKVQEMTSRYFILAMGGRPRYPDIPGCKEYCITSDDLFSLPYAPGKTLCIGASYVSLECAGFLTSLGFDVTVMVRSILLRGFDQQMAEEIGKYMADHGTKFIRPCVPVKIERLEEGQPGRYRVTGKMQDGTEVVDEYNTIVVAVGRDPCTKGIGLDTVGVDVDPKTGFVLASDGEQTSCPNIYAIGDVLKGRPELTPVAIQAGRLLAKRLFTSATLKCDYVNVPTTVFTPLEYGAIGMPEEVAIDKFGQGDIEVYHSHFLPLEWTLPHREENVCYAKLICVKSLKEKVIGLHVLGPNAGEITQGFTIGIKLGATKADFDNAIGIHPTCAEIFTTMNITKNSGVDISVSGC